MKTVYVNRKRQSVQFFVKHELAVCLLIAEITPASYALAQKHNRHEHIDYHAHADFFAFAENQYSQNTAEYTAVNRNSAVPYCDAIHKIVP